MPPHPSLLAKDQGDFEYEDVLEINVNVEPTKTKVPMFVDMKKQSERGDLYGKQENNDEEVALNVNFTQLDKKVDDSTVPYTQSFFFFFLSRSKATWLSVKYRIAKMIRLTTRDQRRRKSCLTCRRRR